MRNAPTNHDDMIDSRDVIERIEELESERGDLESALAEAREAQEARDLVNEGRDGIPLSEADSNPVGDLEDQLAEWDRDNGDELKALKDLESEAEGYAGDWRHGESLIRDSYFEDYARELASDLGLLQKGASWPYTCIDWEQAASELQQDYTSVEFDGVTYWIR
jgi:hypothetical protein